MESKDESTISAGHDPTAEGACYHRATIQGNISEKADEQNEKEDDDDD